MTCGSHHAKRSLKSLVVAIPKEWWVRWMRGHPSLVWQWLGTLITCSCNAAHVNIVRWTRRDVFIHIHSFMKNKQNSEFLYRKLHSRKCHIWSIIFHIWNFIHENVTSGPLFFHIWNFIHEKMSHLVHHYLHIWNFIHENVTSGPSFFIHETSFTKKSHLVHHQFTWSFIDKKVISGTSCI